MVEKRQECLLFFVHKINKPKKKRHDIVRFVVVPS